MKLGIVLVLVLQVVWSQKSEAFTTWKASFLLEPDNVAELTAAVQPKSCLEIKSSGAGSTSGLYTIYSKYGFPYTTYCEMESFGGGWTLVASIHENRMAGKCTFGDRWSSETGLFTRDGESNWENFNTFGRAEYATSDDYKNVGYFEIEAKRFMIIQVPNDTPVSDYVSSATFQYYTSTTFLGTYGGNFHELFKRYPLKDKKLTYDSDNGPSTPITFLKGDPTSAHDQLGTAYQKETESGFAQFRAVTYEKGATGFCPYGKIRPGKYNVEHGCFGGTTETYYCGDFAGFDHGNRDSWATTVEMQQSTFLILYR